ncbi:hypothetical protein HDU98_001197 [Podochytrium sp. JEL0797]|nr:hypothetical protein HDU98_001197 [Podochytrium sp. JEL0797]
MEKIATTHSLSVPYPEMFFGLNTLEMRNETTGLVLEFSAVAALQCVAFVTGGKAIEGVKVAYSKEWTEKSEKLHGKIKQIEKPYDWTYTPESYNGRVVGGLADENSSEARKFTRTESKIDVEMLKRNDPILWYDEIVLYEDELADNGACMLTARVRVMPTCFLILLRFFLRVDNVLFRIHDTRVFHAFDSQKLVRETSKRECSYQRVLNKISSAAVGGGGPTTRPMGRAAAVVGAVGVGRDLSLLNKADWVAQGMVDPFGVEEGVVVVDGVTVVVERDEIAIA